MKPELRYAHDRLLSLMRDISSLDIPAAAHDSMRDIRRLARNALNSINLGVSPDIDVHGIRHRIVYIQALVRDPRVRAELDAVYKKVLNVMKVLKSGEKNGQ
ncbi:MAG: hypothetical protein QXE52_07980 [Candidatus Caldarchaeum sp.]